MREFIDESIQRLARLIGAFEGPRHPNAPRTESRRTAVDALGLPVRFEIGPGQQNDMAPACDLVAGLASGKVLADRAYDADSLHDAILNEGGEPVIPPRRHRRYQHRYDRIAYKNRWGIESFFARLKQWRRIATRYDKLAASFLGFLKIAAIMLWLK